MTEKQNNKYSKKSQKAYYFNSEKFVRDLVHGYVYLTGFDIELISTEQFQRLRDIRQLTCQSVYPAARHTRFEHSLGMMELTRQAIHNLNLNKFIANDNSNLKIIDEQLTFNASLAALLHDVGHCPFSHMGELEFSPKDIWERLFFAVGNCEELTNSPLANFFQEINTSSAKKPGAIHEQLSCIMILEKFKNILSSVTKQNVILENGNTLYVDYELIIRSILGIPYDMSTPENFSCNKEKNVIITLINSKAFDMDKLDYVMRDSFYTGIGTPHIDTNRLFRNMHLNGENDYKLVFKNRAVPVLQNFIEARDSLYMYVYNHHTAVFSDFMNSYIFRRLAHNKRDLFELTTQLLKSTRSEKSGKSTDENGYIANYELLLSEYYEPITNLGLVPKDYLFSSEAIIDQNRSDSDLLSLLNILNFSLGAACNSSDNLEQYIDGEIKELLEFIGIDDYAKLKKEKQFVKQKKELAANIKHVYQLIKNYQCHNYLKPWWKTNSEFKNFLTANFKDDRIRTKLCSWISRGKSNSVSSHEFRSQLAKNVINITQCLYKDKKVKSDLISPLDTGEFFVIERSARFFDPDTISELDIALKSNEILGSPKEVKYRSGEFYIKMLPNVIPQRDYYSMYAKDSFYVFSKRLTDDDKSLEDRNAHYHQIEQIFIFVAETLITDGERNFNYNYNTSKDNEILAHKKMYEKFKKFLLN